MVVKVTAYWEGGYRCRIPVRGHELLVDEPPEYGGADTGPMPTELFLSSLAACFTMAVYHAARKRGIELSDLATSVTGDYEGLCFSKIHVEVHSNSPREVLEPLLERAVDYCYVSNTLLRTPALEYAITDEPVTQEPAPGRA